MSFWQGKGTRGVRSGSGGSSEVSRPAERGTRGVRSGGSSSKGGGVVRRRSSLRCVPRGFLLGDGESRGTSRWYYDLDGRYVRVRGRKVICELFGPQRALAQLTEAERDRVIRARTNARRAGRLDVMDGDHPAWRGAGLKDSTYEGNPHREQGRPYRRGNVRGRLPVDGE